MKSELAYAALAITLVLGGCDEQQRTIQGTAGGEVLEGSVSDAMLPVDRVRSQPPLAAKAEDGDKPGSQRDSGGKARVANPASPDPGAGVDPPGEAPAASDADVGGDTQGRGDAPAQSAPAQSTPDGE